MTISADQIRSAPTDVRKWIEGEVAGALGLQAPTPATQRQGERLAVCSAEEVGGILSLIQGVLPVVNVFFELGHQGVSFGQGALEACRLSDLLHRLRAGRHPPGAKQFVQVTRHRFRAIAEVAAERRLDLTCMLRLEFGGRCIDEQAEACKYLAGPIAVRR